MSFDDIFDSFSKAGGKKPKKEKKKKEKLIKEEITEPKKPKKKSVTIPKTEPKPEVKKKSKPTVEKKRKLKDVLDDISQGEVPDDTPEKKEVKKKSTIKKKKAQIELKKASSSRSMKQKQAVISASMLRKLISSKEPGFRTEEVDEEEDRTVYCIVGFKASSKTTLAMSFDKSELDDRDDRKKSGTVIACISLDRQSNKIAKQYREAYWKNYPENEELVKMREEAFNKYNEENPYDERDYINYKYPEQVDVVTEYLKKIPANKCGYIHTDKGVRGVKEIHVWNGVYYYTTESPKLKTLSAEATYLYILDILDNQIAPMQPDYIIIDDMEVMNVISEMTMRQRNDKTAHEGFKNRNLWKERNDYIDHVFTRSLEYSIVAPIFTTYFKMQEVKDEKTGIIREKEPAWIDKVKKESNVVIFVENKYVIDRHIWYGVIQSSKDPGWANKKQNVVTDYCGNGGVRNLISKFEVYTEEEEAK